MLMHVQIKVILEFQQIIYLLKVIHTVYKTPGSLLSLFREQDVELNYRTCKWRERTVIVFNFLLLDVYCRSQKFHYYHNFGCQGQLQNFNTKHC